jgi:hypothetical protein
MSFVCCNGSERDASCDDGSCAGSSDNPPQVGVTGILVALARGDDGERGCSEEARASSVTRFDGPSISASERCSGIAPPASSSAECSVVVSET